MITHAFRGVALCPPCASCSGFAGILNLCPTHNQLKATLSPPQMRACNLLYGLATRSWNACWTKEAQKPG